MKMFITYLYDEIIKSKGFIDEVINIKISSKEGLLMNFFINAGLFGIPYQYELSEVLGVDVPWTILFDNICF